MKSPPALAVPFPRFDLFGFEAWTQEQKRRVEIVPERVPGKIERIKVVPPEVVTKVSERLARLTVFGENNTIIIFDPHAIIFEDASLSRSWDRGEDGRRLGCRYPSLVGPEHAGLPARGERKPARSRSHDQLTHRLPALQSA